MANVLNTVDSVAPNIPENLGGKIQMAATYALDRREAGIFDLALRGVSHQLSKEKTPKNLIRNLVILFTKDGTYTIQDDYSMGSIGTYAVFSVQAWRDREWSDLNLLTCFLEELCHHFFSIEDEEIVKLKVYEIAKGLVVGDLEFNDLYLPDWKEGYPHLY